MGRFDPFGVWIASIEATRLAIEAQTVVALRLWGMAGIWSIRPTEPVRMFTEKPAAFVEAAAVASHAMLKGRSPDQVARAAMRPLRRKTRANVRRLSKRGVRRT
ncbi:MAG: antifreeze protein [Pseudomonadota bacterium]